MLPIATDGLLTQAQYRKIDRLLDRAGVGPGTRLLEIGTGWGELAIRAASRGANVVSVTHLPRTAGAGHPADRRGWLRATRFGSSYATTGRSRASSTRSCPSR